MINVLEKKRRKQVWDMCFVIILLTAWKNLVVIDTNGNDVYISQVWLAVLMARTRYQLLI